MQYIPTAEVKIDLTRALPEMQELILMVSISQPNQHEFFKALDLWMGETMTKIEEARSKAATEFKDSPNNKT